VLVVGVDVRWWVLVGAVGVVCLVGMHGVRVWKRVSWKRLTYRNANTGFYFPFFLLRIAEPRKTCGGL
jgi:uncharacterized membrane protein